MLRRSGHRDDYLTLAPIRKVNRVEPFSRGGVLIVEVTARDIFPIAHSFRVVSPLIRFHIRSNIGQVLGELILHPALFAFAPGIPFMGTVKGYFFAANRASAFPSVDQSGSSTNGTGVQTLLLFRGGGLPDIIYQSASANRAGHDGALPVPIHALSPVVPLVASCAAFPAHTPIPVVLMVRPCRAAPPAQTIIPIMFSGAACTADTGLVKVVPLVTLLAAHSAQAAVPHMPFIPFRIAMPASATVPGVVFVPLRSAAYAPAMPPLVSEYSA